MRPSSVILMLCLLTPTVWAQTNNDPDILLAHKDGLRIRLVPTGDEAMNDLGTKTITIKTVADGVEVHWFSQTRSLAQEEPWPEYKVFLNKGILKTATSSDATAFAHPHMWASGYYNLTGNSLLWLPNSLLQAETRNKEQPFEPGFLGPAFSAFAHGPQELMGQIRVFRDLVEMIAGVELDTNAKISKKELKELKAFVREFSQVRILTSKKPDSLVLNDEKVKVPVIVVGNAYVEYQALQYDDNPLILSVTFDPTRAPKTVKPLLNYFRKYLEYRITQVKTQ